MNQKLRNRFHLPDEQMLTENSLHSAIRGVISIPFGVVRRFFMHKKIPPWWRDFK